MRLLFALAIAALGAADGVGPPDAVLVFKAEAYVKGPQVRLGDIAEIEGEAADALGDVEIMPAAQPGGSKRLDAGFVVARLKSCGYETLSVEVKGAKWVQAKTMSQEIAPETIAGDLRQYIEEQMPWDPLATEIEVTAPEQAVVAPEGEVAFEWRAPPDYVFVGPGSFRGSVTVDGVPVRAITCKAAVETYANVVVAAAAIPRGKPIMPGDVVKETRLLSALKEPAFAEPAELFKYTARAAIVQGQAIGRSMVSPRVLVRRKQLVTVEMATGGLRVQTQAEAQSNAAEGEAVACVNASSKQPFVGVVRADGIVVVQ